FVRSVLDKKDHKTTAAAPAPIAAPAPVAAPVPREIYAEDIARIEPAAGTPAPHSGPCSNERHALRAGGERAITQRG
ncbi:MAG: hypothetical protein LRY62_03665, partial [Alphaproteobacteria bacterium]|nr:hypothetical protein [Alphaproteobacteria bacterium]